MQASEIFLKTPKGKSEIEVKTDALSMKERRVLILVNGENNAATLQRLSLCDNIDEILQNLLQLEFITATGDSSAPTKAESEAGSSGDVDAREFMCNTLLTFGNRMRVAKLVDEINHSADIDGLKNLVKPWYQAVAETPGGMYQADDLRKEVLQLIHNEEVGA